jgi:hypothetical protein
MSCFLLIFSKSKINIFRVGLISCSGCKSYNTFIKRSTRHSIQLVDYFLRFRGLMKQVLLYKGQGHLLCYSHRLWVIELGLSQLLRIASAFLSILQEQSNKKLKFLRSEIFIYLVQYLLEKLLFTKVQSQRFPASEV